MLPYCPGGEQRPEVVGAGAEVGDLEPYQKKGLESQLQHGKQSRRILHQSEGAA
jgi:hypothetical protein